MYLSQKIFKKINFSLKFCNLRKTEYLYACWQTNQCNKETERNTQKQFHDLVLLDLTIVEKFYGMGSTYYEHKEAVENL